MIGNFIDSIKYLIRFSGESNQARPSGLALDLTWLDLIGAQLLTVCQSTGGVSGTHPIDLVDAAI